MLRNGCVYLRPTAARFRIGSGKRQRHQLAIRRRPRRGGLFRNALPTRKSGERTPSLVQAFRGASGRLLAAGECQQRRRPAECRSRMNAEQRRAPPRRQLLVPRSRHVLDRRLRCCILQAVGRPLSEREHSRRRGRPGRRGRLASAWRSKQYSRWVLICSWSGERAARIWVGQRVGGFEALRRGTRAETRPVEVAEIAPRMSGLPRPPITRWSAGVDETGLCAMPWIDAGGRGRRLV
jgi:hypothetical protein